MKDYERYMNRQRMSETGMVKLLKLETERPEKRETAGKEREVLPRWVKYLGMAASLVLVVGLFALPIVRQARQRAISQPTQEELTFHQVDSVPFTDKAIAGGIPLTAMEPADAAEIFGCAPDDFVGFLETVGLNNFDMEYYAVDMAHYPLGVAPQGDDGYRFLMKGSYISPREKPENWDEISETDWEMWKGVSNFFPGNDVWLEIYEGHSYQDEADWKALEPQTFHGCQVTAAYDENNYHAAAAFDLESGGKTYGVLYSAVTYGDCNAKELVTQMVRYLTTNGLFIEDRGTDTEPPALTYAELTQPFSFVNLPLGDLGRPLTRQELEAVFPAAAGEDGVNYTWEGKANFTDDDNLWRVVITGKKMDGTETVTISAAKEERLVFTRNMVEKNGETTYFGADNTMYLSGLDLARCFYVDEWEHTYLDASTASDAPNYNCYVQCKVAGSPLYTQVKTNVSNGTLLENETFNTQWFDTVNKTGLWFHTGNVNGKDIWQLPEVEEASVQEYATLDDLRASVDEKFLPYLPTTLMDHDEFHGIWRRNNAEYESVDVRWDKPWIIEGSYARFSYSGDIDVKWPLVAMGLPEVTDVNDRENYDFRKHPGLQFPDGSQGYEGIYEKLYCPTFRAQDASLDLIESRIYHWDPEDEIDGYPEAKTECRFQLLHDNNVLVNYLFQGMTAEEIWKVVESTLPTQLLGPYFMETDEDTAFVPRIVFYADGGFSCVSDLASSHYCVGRYSVQNGRVTAGCDQHRFVFEIDGDALRYVGAASDKMVRYIAPEVTDGTVFRHETDEDGNVLDYDHTPIQYGKYQTSVANVRTGETDAVLIEQS